jgi:hypothetical protein
MLDTSMLVTNSGYWTAFLNPNFNPNRCYELGWGVRGRRGSGDARASKEDRVCVFKRVCVLV